MDDRISKEAKLKATTDILASYLRGAAAAGTLQPDKVPALFKEIFQAIDETVPEGGARKIGLG
jgi:hypothetical protein